MNALLAFTQIQLGLKLWKAQIRCKCQCNIGDCPLNSRLVWILKLTFRWPGITAKGTPIFTSTHFRNYCNESLSARNNFSCFYLFVYFSFSYISKWLESFRAFLNDKPSKRISQLPIMDASLGVLTIFSYVAYLWSWWNAD